MRSFVIAVVCCSMWACGSDPEAAPASDGGGIPAPTLTFGAACTDSTECIGQLCVAVSDTRAVCSVGCADRSACPAGESWDCVLPSGAAASLCACTSNADTEICGDGRDNDCDGVTDCTSDGLDAGIDSGIPDASQDDASMCPPEGCGPAATCESDPGLCPLCEDGTDCDDGKFCTEDICRAGGCVHIPRDNICAATEICDPRSATGCTPSKACASDADCEDDDACTTAEFCDTTAAICRMGFLDADRDQHLPMVCGGDDCNDADQRSYPGALDVCDNRDNNCDGMIDPPSAALSCAGDRMCQTGVCVCGTGLEECRSSCVDPANFQTDERNCGGCGINCALGELCTAGLCEDIDECADASSCPEHSTCVNYTPGYDCPCDDGYTDSGLGTCVDFDECAADTNDCDESPGDCADGVGSYECSCPSTHIEVVGGGVLGCASRVTALATGNIGLFNCALLQGGRVQCWGYNEYGQLGLGSVATRGDSLNELVSANELTNLGTGRTAKALVTGGSHTCAILDDDSVKCWGYNEFGQLGIGSTLNRGDGLSEVGDALVSVALGTGRTAKALTAGSLHTCAILDDNTVKCWGMNSSGQLGRDDTVSWGLAANQMGDMLAPVNLGAGRTAKMIAAGANHTCAILDNDTVKCWGYNNAGQLGLENTETRGDAVGEMASLAPVNLGTGLTAKAISAGSAHTCAVLSNDAVKCWGSNSDGQLGINSNTHRGDAAAEMGDALPVAILGAGRSAKAIAAGTSHTCAILDNNTIKCWGRNDSAQLGTGDTEAYGDAAGTMELLAPVSVGTGRTVVGMKLGNYHTCALLDNQRVKCWGPNDDGQLGTGDFEWVGGSPADMGDALRYVRLGS